MLQLPTIEQIRATIDKLNITNASRFPIQQFTKLSESISYCTYTCTSYKKVQLTTIFIQICVNDLTERSSSTIVYNKAMETVPPIN